MIKLDEMKNSIKKNIRVTTHDGIMIEGYCTEYLWPEDNDEEHNITIKKSGSLIEINQSEIKSIEILE